MGYEIRALNPDRVREVENQWSSIAGAQELQAEYSHMFEWCRGSPQADSGYAPAAEFRSTSNGECHAILEVFDTKGGALTKLLRVHASPRYWNTDRDPAIEREAVIIHAEIFTQVVSDGILKGARDVKIYGREDRMFKLLGRIHDTWQGRDTLMTAHMEGRWLRMSLREEPR